MSKTYTYKESTEYISDVPRFTKKTDPKNNRILLAKLGNPQNCCKAVHVAGTNGKGSVSKMIALMLEEAGFRTGLFISPHLIRMNERMSINGVDISDDDFASCFSEVMNAVSELLEKEPEFQHPAYFEFIFAMAAVYFSKQSVDYVVYETGLGGRLDATNIVIPEVSVITSIGMDHMQYLGNTITEIAGEKAGIIKPEVPVVYNTGRDEADRVIENRARSKASEYISARLEREEGGNKSQIRKLVEESFGVTQPLYQYENASTAIEAYLIISGKNLEECEEVIRRALASFTMPGRMQFLEENIVIDGAHNEDAIEKCIASVNRYLERGRWKKVSLMFAVSSDKDYETIIRLLCQGLPLEDVYISEINSDRREDVSEVMKLFGRYLPKEKANNIYGSTNMKNMWELAKSELDGETLLLAVGSLYMIGEILTF
ncbi:MAG: bifunctional folylpolyglutamate synthase/dihydrofolate synthase [Eubacterium sp.]|nr:bifunctional folylpolyglutamate synthase/dihydrofolate synthase [Eubacterium sp.]